MLGAADANHEDTFKEFAVGINGNVAQNGIAFLINKWGDMMFWIGLVIGIIIGIVSLSIISCIIVSGQCSRKEEKSKFDKKIWITTVIKQIFAFI